MKFNPHPKQTFLILSMLFGTTQDEREPMQSKTDLDKALRKELERAGLVRLEKRRSGRSSAMHLVLEDAAWDFVVNHLGGELPDTKRAAKLLRVVLARLHAFMQAHDHSLAEFVTDKASEATEPLIAAQSKAVEREAPRQGASEAEIRDACLALAHGETRKRVRLKDLRANVSLGRDALDRTLLSMQTAGRLVLYKMDNPAEISPEDERAALFIAGQPRHLVYLEA